MSLIRFRNVSKRYEHRPVLREVCFRLERGDRLGLIGKNGAGKTTVLRLILGQTELDGGAIDIEDGLRIGYFSQFSEPNQDESIQTILEKPFAHFTEIEAQLAGIDAELAHGVDDKQQARLLQRQGALLERLENEGGWTFGNTINTVLTRLGFSEAARHKPVAQLSGGWRNRAALAKILIEDPDVLLLDEPTNYLDVAGLAWLEQWLQKIRGAVVVISHDRQFLEAVATRIVEIENYHFQEYAGNFTEYVRIKRLRFKTLQNQFQHEEELLAYESEAIEERREAARDPDNALKRKLANIKKRVEPRPIERVVTRLYENLSVGNILCRVKGVAMAYGSQMLFENLSFDVARGDRLAIVGPNGCGKTTLLNVLTGQAAPVAGEVKWAGATLPYCYFNEVLDALDGNDTVTHAVNVVGLAYSAPRKTVNDFLGMMQFAEMDLRRKIGTLSGGQRARVALAQCLLSGAGAIILDEPTNHLDITSCQVIEKALANFPGAVLVVSHDRFFIDKVATRLLVFSGAGHVDSIAGNYTTWAQSRA